MKRTTHSRRTFLKRTASLAALAGAPTIIPSTALGLDGATAPSERIGLAGIGMGGQGRSDLEALMKFPQIQVVAVCDVVGQHCQMAKRMVDHKYGSTDCATYSDFRKVLRGLTSMRCSSEHRTTGTFPSRSKP